MLSKVLSGRFLFTIIAGIVFAVLAISGKLPVDKVQEIILIVVYAYFSKPREQKGEQAK
ncbi:MAG: hypothetical protein WCY09_01590 [Candidatus Omnitrophota bacterium]|jgi:hypothetical protein